MPRIAFYKPHPSSEIAFHDPIYRDRRMRVA